MDIELAVLIGAMGASAVAFLKFLRAGQYWDAATLVVVIGVCIGVAFLVQAADVALQGKNAAYVVIAGYMAGSAFRVVYETVKAVGGAFAKEPKLFTAPGGSP